LNRLGAREPEIYGATTLDQINTLLINKGKELGVSVDCFQTNHEGELIDRIHQAPAKQVGFIVMNPAAFTHTSVAVRDAMASVNVPFVEVHLSNVHRREPFRHTSYFSDIAQAVICGLGVAGYVAALEFAVASLKAAKTS
jgi:3-dehydroquinate dehydratase-2